MVRLAEMLCRVFAGRRVATAHVATGHALTQRNPPGAFFQAFFAGHWHARRRKVALAQVLKVFAWLVHTFCPLTLGLYRFGLVSHCLTC